MLQDLRFALRQLRRTPVFASVTTLTLALGIGANTAVFSVMNAVVLRWLPIAEPDRVVFLHAAGHPRRSSQTGFDDTSLTMPIFQALRNESRAFSHLMAFVPLDISRTTIRHGAEPETAWADMVSGNFFSGLGVPMARGRALTMEDERGHTPTAVLSYGFWTRRFARNPSIVGDTLFVKGIPFTVVGVASQDFTGVEHNNATDIWIPIQDRPELKPWGRPAESPDGFQNSPTWWFLMTMGRLAPNTTEAQALAIAQPIFQRAAFETLGQPGPSDPVP